MNSEHFNKIFWYITGMSIIVLGYIVAITFFEIPKENVRFADTSQGFLLGSLLGSGVSYLLGGSPALPTTQKKQSQAGTTTADIDLQITQTDKQENKPQ